MSMSKLGKRCGLILLAALCILALSALALTEDAWAGEYEEQSPGWTDPLRLDGSLTVPSGDPGQSVTIIIPVIFSTEFGWSSVRDITVTPVMSDDAEKWPFVINRSPYTIPLSLSNRRARANFTFTISQEVKAGLYPVEFKLVYVAANGLTRQSYNTTVTAYVRVLSDGVDYKGDDEDDKSLIVIGAASAPTGRILEDVTPPRVTMELPLVNTSAALYDVTIEPIITTELNEFPFVVEQQTYKQTLGNFYAGETRSISYDFQLSEHATAGAKAVKFKLEYTQNGTKMEGTITAYVNVEREDEEDDDKKTSKPKLIVSSYTIDPDKVFAGNNFTLDMTFTNTSSETIKNITITINNNDPENAYVVPARSGSNTIYLSSLGAGASITRSLEMQVRPDTPAKPNMMDLKFDYENYKNESFNDTYNITVPINQELRVTVDDPRIDYPFAEQGGTVYTYFSVINMGKSSIYNGMVRVEGPGLSLEESLYMGTIQSGGQYNVDVGIVCAEAGDITGEIIVSYEDDFGDVQEERKPITIYVEEPYIPEFDEDMMGGWEEPMPEDGGGGGVWKWIGIAAAVVAVVVVVIVVRKRKAAKRLAELEEDDAA